MEPIRICLIDDDPEDILIHMDYLNMAFGATPSDKTYQIDFYENPEEAEKHIELFDLIIVDELMGLHRGSELIKRWRKERKLKPDAYCIIMTGTESPESYNAWLSKNDSIAFINLIDLYKRNRKREQE